MRQRGPARPEPLAPKGAPSYPADPLEVMVANTPMDTDKIKIYGSRV